MTHIVSCFLLPMLNPAPICPPALPTCNATLSLAPASAICQKCGPQVPPGGNPQCLQCSQNSYIDPDTKKCKLCDPTFGAAATCNSTRALTCKASATAVGTKCVLVRPWEVLKQPGSSPSRYGQSGGIEGGPETDGTGSTPVAPCNAGMLGGGGLWGGPVSATDSRGGPASSRSLPYTPLAGTLQNCRAGYYFSSKQTCLLVRLCTAGASSC